jgi:hypothetical protein
LGGLFLIGLIGFCCTSVVMLLILGGSATALLAWFAGIWNSIAQYNNLQPSTSIAITLQAPPAIIQQPNISLIPTERAEVNLPTWTPPSSELMYTITPTSLPLSSNDGQYYSWSTWDMPLMGFTIDLPQGWYLGEKRKTFVGNACGLGHDIADYSVSPIIGSEITINFICGPRGWEGSACLDETTILDEDRGIVRGKITNNEYLYEYFSRNKNGIECMDGWKITDIVVMMADYKVTAGPIQLPIVDRIVLSVHKK